jgi:hypothetical protein
MLLLNTLELTKTHATGTIIKTIGFYTKAISPSSKDADRKFLAVQMYFERQGYETKQGVFGSIEAGCKTEMRKSMLTANVVKNGVIKMPFRYTSTVNGNSCTVLKTTL